MRGSTWKTAAVTSEVSLPVVCAFVFYFRSMRDGPGLTSSFALVTTCCSVHPGISLYYGLQGPPCSAPASSSTLSPAT